MIARVLKHYIIVYYLIIYITLHDYGILQLALVTNMKPYKPLFLKTIKFCVYCSIVTGFASNHSPAEVFSVQSRHLPDPKCLMSNTVRLQAIDSANKKVAANLASDSSAKKGLHAAHT